MKYSKETKDKHNFFKKFIPKSKIEVIPHHTDPESIKTCEQYEKLVNWYLDKYLR